MVKWFPYKSGLEKAIVNTVDRLLSFVLLNTIVPPLYFLVKSHVIFYHVC